MNYLVLLFLAFYFVPFHGSGLLLWMIIVPFTVWYWNWASSGMSVRRKFQIASWEPSSDGTILAKLSFDASKLLDWIEKKRVETGVKITLTHAVGKAVALAIKKTPSLNGYIFMGRFIPFKTVDLSFLTTLEGGKNLFHAKIDKCDEKKVVDVATTLNERAAKIRDMKDEDFHKTMGPAQMLPTWILGVVLHVAGWAASSLGLSLPMFGVKPFPFGSCLITSIGSLGIYEGFAPFTPFARTPMLVAIGAVKKGVVVENDQAVVRPKLKIMATIDHRFLDGAQAKDLVAVMTNSFNNPDSLDELLQ